MRIFRSEGPRREPVVEQNAPPAAELSDEALIHAIAAKEVWAMDQLYERYNRLLYSLTFRMVSDHQIAEDLLQESFLSVWRNAASYSRQMGEVRSWLVSIIHHRTIDYLRATRRRAGLNNATLDDVERDESVATPDVWDEAWMSIQGAQVRDALTKLSQEQRKVIEMGYFQGWTHSEIAEGLQLPLGTVKARMRLGLMHMKRILQQMGIDGL
jgi:RNA polymerase sigma factor (sigma-70 family)